MEYDNNNRVALWKNDRRDKETSPQLKGQGMIDGKEYWVSAWTNKDAGKKPLISLSFTMKDAPLEAPKTVTDVNFDDDLPF